MGDKREHRNITVNRLRRGTVTVYNKNNSPVREETKDEGKDRRIETIRGLLRN